MSKICHCWHLYPKGDFVMTHTIIYQFSCQLRPHSNPFFSECNLISSFIIVDWYFVSKIVLTYCEKNCSSDREKYLKFEAEGREYPKILRSEEQFL